MNWCCFAGRRVRCLKQRESGAALRFSPHSRTPYAPTRAKDRTYFGAAALECGDNDRREAAPLFGRLSLFHCVCPQRLILVPFGSHPVPRRAKKRGPWTTSGDKGCSGTPSGCHSISSRCGPRALPWAEFSHAVGVQGMAPANVQTPVPGLARSRKGAFPIGQ